MPTAESCLTPELINKWGLVDEWSLAGCVPRFRGQEFAEKVIFGSPLVEMGLFEVLGVHAAHDIFAANRFRGRHRFFCEDPTIGEFESSAALGNLPEWQRCQFSAQRVGVTRCRDQGIELL
jgi:hypothetical protein